MPQSYQCPLDASGLRRDKQQRAELCRGSVDFVVPKVFALLSFYLSSYCYLCVAEMVGHLLLYARSTCVVSIPLLSSHIRLDKSTVADRGTSFKPRRFGARCPVDPWQTIRGKAVYCLRPEQQPIFVFCVDVSPRALETGFTAACLSAVETALGAVPGGERARVGLMTFDRCIHVYRFDDEGRVSQMVVAADAEVLLLVACCRAGLAGGGREDGVAVCPALNWPSCAIPARK